VADLSERLAALTPERRALLEERLRKKGLSAPRPSVIRPIPGRERMSRFPTSLDQERLWFIDQMEPGNPAYNIHTTTRLIGAMDVDAMRRAINLSVARHEVLRTTFSVVDGRPVQVVAPRLEIELPIVDLQDVPAAEREAAALRASIEAASVRFDLERGPLVQTVLARLGREDHVLMICMQHAVTDRWSFDVFEREVGEAYMALREGREPDLPALPIQFADFAAWQREELSGERLERHLAWWRERLDGAPMVLEIPTDRPRPPVQTFSGGREYVTYPKELMRELKALTQRGGATMFMTMLAALDVLCWKYSGQRDVVIGSAIADRNRPETENVIGYFLNMLLLRGTIDPGMCFEDLLAQVRDTALGAYAHQDVPFATLVDEMKPRQDPSRNPLIQVSFIYLDFPLLSTAEYAGFQASSLDVDNGASRFDLTLACWELPEGIHGYIEYNTDLYDGPKVARMLRHLGRILEFAVAHPRAPLRDVDMLEPAERARSLAGARGPAADFGDADLSARFRRAAALRPDGPALVVDGRRETFGTLAAMSGRVARALRRRGVRPGTLVPVCADRSVEQVVALLGVLEAGGAYVPLDPSLPEERRASMLADVKPALVLAQDGRLPRDPGGVPWLSIEDLLAEDAAGDDAPPVRFFPDEPAYVMFTSGSTGTPKGVMVSHRAIANRILWSQGRYPIRPGDRVLHNASFAFDIAAWELLGPLIAGACVVMPREGEHKDPAAIARLLREERVNVAHFVPSLLRAVLEEPDFAACDALRTVLCGGEGLDRETHDRFFRRLPGRTLAHFYGPTEAAISCVAFDCREDLAPGAVPLGAPIANMTAYLLDDELRLVPDGVPGEVWLGGVGLARGYLARPDLTAERFLPDPISGQPGARLYRTGDVAIRREDGALEFRGRADHQIKIRGHRIEPGEIETVLERMPGIARAIAGARGSGAEQRLVAWVVAEASAEAPAEPEMRAALRKCLPESMVPAAFVVLDALPLNANGKVDRAALPEPGAARAIAVHVPPRTPSEEAVCGIWQELLKRERVGALDDFFELGGNSLLATQVVSRLKAAFPVDLPLRRFFEGSTVEALASVVDELLVSKLESLSEEEAATLLESVHRAKASG
jgi:amino acid adenylation domain-containing protein